MHFESDDPEVTRIMSIVEDLGEQRREAMERFQRLMRAKMPEALGALREACNLNVKQYEAKTELFRYLSTKFDG